MRFIFLITGIMPLTACIPRIEVAPPKEPVTINMNVKIDHEIHINMDDQLKTLLEHNSELLTPHADKQPPAKTGDTAKQEK